MAAVTKYSSVYSNGDSGYHSGSPVKREIDMDDDDMPLTQKVRMVQPEVSGKRSFEAALDASSSNRVKNHSGNLVTHLKKEIKAEVHSDDDLPLSSRIKDSSSKKRKIKESDDEYSELKKKRKMENTKEKNSSKKSENKDVKKETVSSPSKKKKKVEEEEEIWKWWEEDSKPDGVKWRTLVHKGPVFAPDYVPLPQTVHFKYSGETEEVASFYAKMLTHEYTTKEIFNENFFKDWRKVMTAIEREKIKELAKCDFREMSAYYQQLTEEKKAMTKEEKLKIKEAKEAEAKEYGFAVIDGHRQKIGNFRIEPPGLFRGRGGHPKMGCLKRRVQPEDVIINCSKGSEIPIPPAGHKWKEVRHDNTVTWLCAWTENVLGQIKYIMLNPSSKIKGEKDYEKFETARRLKSRIDDIREVYTTDFKSKEMRIRQRAVALYFIDKLALRAGNEKDIDEAADTVGCCSLRCEHIKLHPKLDEKEYVVEFDFLGKDSIRYYNKVQVEKRVFNNLKLFMENKDPGDDLFDRLDTTSLNQHLQSLMPGLTVKVFRTYNASITLQQQLEKLTKEDSSVQEYLLSYNRANRQVAILCNHQRAVPKSHEKSMENLAGKIKAKKAEVKEAKASLQEAKGETAINRAKKRLERVKEQLKRLKIQRTDKDENKQIALGTSKLNYLDPRISVAWCKKNNVPVEKIFNKTQREKFRWAIDMADENFIF
ncbi:unnamed protein product [Dracunculus medinensis]|uniref:DNA topoisomerase I n=1 Tax=Dracunculus medinensis TaxID=318479 RepID=A0A0N4U600_DRAME|nr:unnamed protein product [Dracunculus medinensis]